MWLPCNQTPNIIFLTQRCQLLEALDSRSNSYSKTHTPNKKKIVYTLTYADRACPMCNESHFIYSCKLFRNFPVQKRFSECKHFIRIAFDQAMLTASVNLLIAAEHVKSVTTLFFTLFVISRAVIITPVFPITTFKTDKIRFFNKIHQM